MAKIARKTACGCAILPAEAYWSRAKLIIEIDGSQHFEAHHAEKDRERDEFLNRLGLLVIGVNSRQVLKETDALVEFIYQKVEE